VKEAKGADWTNTTSAEKDPDARGYYYGERG